MNPRRSPWLLLLCAALIPTSACGSPPPPDVELAVVMLRMQVHSAKLHFAIEAQNTELADFYVHELHEAAEEIEAANLMEGSVSLTKAIGQYLEPALKGLEAGLEGDDPGALSVAYDRLLTGCNGCHTATKHGFIVIQKPAFPMWTNQRFTR